MLLKIALFLKDSKIWNIASKRMPEAGQVDVWGITEEVVLKLQWTSVYLSDSAPADLQVRWSNLANNNYSMPG